VQRAADPLAVQCQDYWELPVDADALIEPVPRVAGLVPTPHFENAVQRKVYTYNAINATIAYLGHHRGHTYLAQAATDPVILDHALRVMREVNEAMCRAFGYAPADQLRYSNAALEKFQNPLIVDPIERQVRDPIRKLGRHDRLVGPAVLAQSMDVAPEELALSIAAALQYRNPADPSATRLAKLVDDLGPAAALGTVADLEPTDHLVELVVSRYGEVRGLIGAGSRH
jgi:mannitol-1-phosphate 5-dehydrogenase